MMEALTAAGGLGFVPGFGFAHTEWSAASERPSSTAGQEPYEWDVTSDCPVAGSVHTAGEFTYSQEDEATWTSTWDLTQTHQDCVSVAQSDGSQWTFNGDPNLSLDATITETETASGYTGSMSMTQGGAVAWAQGGRSGSCAISLVWDVESTVEDEESYSVSFSVEGTVCGHTVSESDSFSS